MEKVVVLQKKIKRGQATQKRKSSSGGNLANNLNIINDSNSAENDNNEGSGPLFEGIGPQGNKNLTETLKIKRNELQNSTSYELWQLIKYYGPHLFASVYKIDARLLEILSKNLNGSNADKALKEVKAAISRPPQESPKALQRGVRRPPGSTEELSQFLAKESEIKSNRVRQRNLQYTVSIDLEHPYKHKNQVMGSGENTEEKKGPEAAQKGPYHQYFKDQFEQHDLSAMDINSVSVYSRAFTTQQESDDKSLTHQSLVPDKGNNAKKKNNTKKGSFVISSDKHILMREKRSNSEVVANEANSIPNCSAFELNKKVKSSDKKSKNRLQKQTLSRSGKKGPTNKRNYLYNKPIKRHNKREPIGGSKKQKWFSGNQKSNSSKYRKLKNELLTGNPKKPSTAYHHLNKAGKMASKRRDKFGNLAATGPTGGLGKRSKRKMTDQDIQVDKVGRKTGQKEYHGKKYRSPVAHGTAHSGHGGGLGGLGGLSGQPSKVSGPGNKTSIRSFKSKNIGVKKTGKGHSEHPKNRSNRILDEKEAQQRQEKNLSSKNDLRNSSFDDAVLGLGNPKMAPNGTTRAEELDKVSSKKRRFFKERVDATFRPKLSRPTQGRKSNPMNAAILKSSGFSSSRTNQSPNNFKKERRLKKLMLSPREAFTRRKKQQKRQAEASEPSEVKQLPKADKSSVGNNNTLLDDPESSSDSEELSSSSGDASYTKIYSKSARNRSETKSKLELLEDEINHATTEIDSQAALNTPHAIGQDLGFLTPQDSQVNLNEERNSGSSNLNALSHPLSSSNSKSKNNAVRRPQHKKKCSLIDPPGSRGRFGGAERRDQFGNFKKQRNNKNFGFKLDRTSHSRGSGGGKGGHRGTGHSRKQEVSAKLGNLISQNYNSRTGGGLNPAVARRKNNISGLSAKEAYSMSNRSGKKGYPFGKHHHKKFGDISSSAHPGPENSNLWDKYHSRAGKHGGNSTKKKKKKSQYHHQGPASSLHNNTYSGAGGFGETLRGTAPHPGLPEYKYSSKTSHKSSRSNQSRRHHEGHHKPKKRGPAVNPKHLKIHQKQKSEKGGNSRHHFHQKSQLRKGRARHPQQHHQNKTVSPKLTYGVQLGRSKKSQYSHYTSSQSGGGASIKQHLDSRPSQGRPRKPSSPYKQPAQKKHPNSKNRPMSQVNTQNSRTSSGKKDSLSIELRKSLERPVGGFRQQEYQKVLSPPNQNNFFNSQLIETAKVNNYQSFVEKNKMEVISLLKKPNSTRNRPFLHDKTSSAKKDYTGVNSSASKQKDQFFLSASKTVGQNLNNTSLSVLSGSCHRGGFSSSFINQSGTAGTTGTIEDPSAGAHPGKYNYMFSSKQNLSGAATRHGIGDGLGFGGPGYPSRVIKSSQQKNKKNMPKKKNSKQKINFLSKNQNFKIFPPSKKRSLATSGKEIRVKVQGKSRRRVPGGGVGEADCEAPTPVIGDIQTSISTTWRGSKQAPGARPGQSPGGEPKWPKRPKEAAKGISASPGNLPVAAGPRSGPGPKPRKISSSNIQGSEERLIYVPVSSTRGGEAVGAPQAQRQVGSAGRPSIRGTPPVTAVTLLPKGPFLQDTSDLKSSNYNETQENLFKVLAESDHKGSTATGRDRLSSHHLEAGQYEKQINHRNPYISGFGGAGQQGDSCERLCSSGFEFYQSETGSSNRGTFKTPKKQNERQKHLGSNLGFVNLPGGVNLLTPLISSPGTAMNTTRLENRVHGAAGLRTDKYLLNKNYKDHSMEGGGGGGAGNAFAAYAKNIEVTSPDRGVVMIETSLGHPGSIGAILGPGGGAGAPLKTPGTTKGGSGAGKSINSRWKYGSSSGVSIDKGAAGVRIVKKSIG